jgi:drug/metabolite transporter (DMT)-like permease
MLYLGLSILSSTCIFLIFRQFAKYEIDNFQAIVFNYLTAALIGYFLSDADYGFTEGDSTTWIWVSVLMGILFIAMFNVIAVTTQEIGVAVASVASKVSLIIPVLIAVPLYNDEMPWIKVVGIILAVLSVFLTFYTRGKRLQPGKLWILPVILFIGTGVLDTLLKFTQSVLLNKEQFSMFSSMLFAVAGLIGLIVATILIIGTGRKFRIKNALAGLALGVPNYGSIYFLLQSFEHTNMESSVIFPINNMGIVALSAVAAYIFFGEKLSGLNWAGIGTAVLAIGLISMA